VRKGLEGREAAAQAAEPPESPVFCGWPQKMRPNLTKIINPQKKREIFGKNGL
jgi:hypothetical protein